jgi:ketosteroid isomerase-like protein
MSDNKQKVKNMLAAWKDGQGQALMELLSEDIEWTIVGKSLVAGTTRGKTELREKVLGPFGARFAKSSERFRPVTVHGIYQEGDTVVAYFDGRGTANDGKPYLNSYAWFLTFKQGLVVRATAFFDSIAFNDLWQRVTPS